MNNRGKNVGLSAANDNQQSLVETLEAIQSMAVEQTRLLGKAITLSKGGSNAVQTRFKEPSTRADHTRKHRPGKPSKIDVDPELRAFVIARVDTMGFEALAAQIADQFPPDRRVGKSALHSWWQRQPNRSSKSHPQ